MGFCCAAACSAARASAESIAMPTMKLSEILSTYFFPLLLFNHLFFERRYFNRNPQSEYRIDPTDRNKRVFECGKEVTCPFLTGANRENGVFLKFISVLFVVFCCFSRPTKLL